MKFGAFTPQGWRLDLQGFEDGYAEYKAMKDGALRLEKQGYHSVWLYDHFHTVPEARPEATFEVWTATAALAEATSTIRLGQMCGCNIYRPPALLAKMTSVIDCVSNGRLDFGLGAGWYEHETVAYGYDFERPALRIGKLDEAVQIIKGMWTEKQFQFEGKYYTIGHGKVKDYAGNQMELSGAINHPKPIQSPHPPMWLAGGGEQLTLRTVARYADYSNFGGSLEQVMHKNSVLDKHCEKVERDPKDITRSMNVNVMLGSDSDIERLLKESGRNEQHVAAVKNMLFATEPKALVDKLAEYREKARIDYVIVYFPDFLKGDSVERFAAEVIPNLK
jgi:alkanesulfonate monooxygenase SsuD/methylene tetrahydromethanopterin reductase-like flavin-dependent oxidoreductase (luciferase family)